MNLWDPDLRTFWDLRDPDDDDDDYETPGSASKDLFETPGSGYKAFMNRRDPDPRPS